MSAAGRAAVVLALAWAAAACSPGEPSAAAADAAGATTTASAGRTITLPPATTTTTTTTVPGEPADECPGARASDTRPSPPTCDARDARPPAATNPSATFRTTRTSTTTTSTVTTTTTPPQPRTSCRDVAHIGDSTGVALWDVAGVGGDPAATLDARYRAVGVQNILHDDSPGRSMVERLLRQPNAIDVAQAVRDSGFHGCWVLLIGVNDAANVAAGGVPPLAERIERLLAVIGDEPVLWVNAVTHGAAPPYHDASVQAFNEALVAATWAHPNVHVFDWAAVAAPEWFQSDGIHYTTPGSMWRAVLVAEALAREFPA